MFICTWIANCPLAVQSFLSVSNSVSYVGRKFNVKTFVYFFHFFSKLISQICAPTIVDDRENFIQTICSFAFGLCLVFNTNQIAAFSTESLERILNKRIGMDLYLEKLESLAKSDVYAKTLQRPQLKIGKVFEMVLDYEFVRLYKILEGSITRSLTTKNKEEQAKSSADAALLQQYYDFIQQQNQQILFFREQEKHFQDERQNQQNKINELEKNLHETRDQLVLVQQSNEQHSAAATATATQQQAELEYYKNMVVSCSRYQ